MLTVLLPTDILKCVTSGDIFDIIISQVGSHDFTFLVSYDAVSIALAFCYFSLLGSISILVLLSYFLKNNYLVNTVLDGGVLYHGASL